MRIDRQEFLARLKALFESATQKHSVYVLAKRAAEGTGPGAMIFRATDGRKSNRTKFSTTVEPAELPAFQASYVELMHNELNGTLHKRDKAKERRIEKAHAAAIKRFKESGGKLPSGSSKRGAGRRKRTRAIGRIRRLGAESARS
ncbi:hypothetical protein MCUN1_002508 [Malassezia cuniculi]|uniref:Signal recognition particle subunit SRP14 n=1 Tax=Malassezia cuniculi TaxID=948313 RepID=A0AAF0ES29_9BASI|nr:hypothetical protein MCUN1_002508 [Malassezia cuniculi]